MYGANHKSKQFSDKVEIYLKQQIKIISLDKKKVY